MDEKMFQLLSEMEPLSTAHKEGEKFVFLKNPECKTALTQFAYGRFLPGEGCEEHKHPTMEEYFFFLKGAGICIVNEETYQLTPGTFIRIPAGLLHQLITVGADPLEFVYFGVAMPK